MLDRGYTLMEVLTTVVVVGIIGFLALPPYLFYLEKTKLGEGIQILGALRNAQKAYYGESFSYTNDINKLAVSFASSEHFETPAVNNIDPIASVQRKGSYTLSINADGTMACSGGPPDYCAKLGY